MTSQDPQNEKSEKALVARMVESRLKARLQEETSDHPDEDAIAAFVEGRIAEADSQSLVSHLVNCASCLHLTAELIRGEPELDEVSSAAMPEESVGRLQQILDRISGSLVPSVGEEAVFAYEEKTEASDGEKSDRDDK